MTAGAPDYSHLCLRGRSSDRHRKHYLFKTEHLNVHAITQPITRDSSRAGYRYEQRRSDRSHHALTGRHERSAGKPDLDDLCLSPFLRANDLKVSVHEGKATLTGSVEESVNKDLAEQIALGVNGIKDVDNQIKVQADYTPPARSADRSYGEVIDDASITSAVESKLVWSKNTEGLTANVETKRGKVTLVGSADSAATKDLAGKLAMGTRGVMSVDNQLVVKSAKAGAAATGKSSAQEVGSDMTDGWNTTKVSPPTRTPATSTGPISR